jgi:hypothetical protein
MDLSLHTVWYSDDLLPLQVQDMTVKAVLMHPLVKSISLYQVITGYFILLSSTNLIHV